MRAAKTITTLNVIWDFCLVIGRWTLYVGIGKKRWGEAATLSRKRVHGDASHGDV